MKVGALVSVIVDLLKERAWRIVDLSVRWTVLNVKVERGIIGRERPPKKRVKKEYVEQSRRVEVQSGRIYSDISHLRNLFGTL